MNFLEKVVVIDVICGFKFRFKWLYKVGNLILFKNLDKRMVYWIEILIFKFFGWSICLSCGGWFYWMK